MPDIFTSESVCTHELPNKLQIIRGGHEFQFADDTYDLDITLSADWSCSAVSSVDNYNNCQWSMMYDQAPLIWLDDEMLMANFRYEVKDNAKKPWEELQTGDYDEFNFKCRETMVGVVRNRINKDFACMQGFKTSPDIPSSVQDDRKTVSMA